jgi:hypothetical protein
MTSIFFIKGKTVPLSVAAQGGKVFLNQDAACGPGIYSKLGRLCQKKTEGKVGGIKQGGEMVLKACLCKVYWSFSDLCKVKSFLLDTSPLFVTAH